MGVINRDLNPMRKRKNDSNNLKWLALAPGSILFGRSRLCIQPWDSPSDPPVLTPTDVFDGHREKGGGDEQWGV
uniref:Uncharacterized protein n=1 Tax=Knipowitschia caucasica TaxID=637954 RepID=A0AAV2JJX3_KNICA